MNIPVIVLCRNSEGAPEFYYTVIDCSPDEYADGLHYEKACEAAYGQGYAPVMAFDRKDPAAKQLPDAAYWMAV